MHGNGRESCSCITTKWKQPQTRLSAHLPHSPDMLYPSMISGLLFLALSSRPGFSVLRSWLLWGEHLSQAHMPTEINSDTPGRSELNSILTPPPSSSYYLLGTPPSSSYYLLVSHSPPQKPYCLQSPQHRQIYQKTTWDGSNSPWQVHISQVSTQVCPSRKLPETRAQPGVP